MFFRIRLVVPSELAHRVSWYGATRQSRNGRLSFVGPFILPEERLPEVLEDLTALNVEWLRANPGAPPVVTVARYEREVPGENDYLALPVALGLYDAEYREVTGHAPRVECEDLSTSDAAEERHRGNPLARAVALWVAAGMRHIITDLGPGRGTRDVSRILLTLFPGNKG